MIRSCVMKIQLTIFGNISVIIQKTGLTTNYIFNKHCINHLTGPRHGVALQTPPYNIVGSCHGITLEETFSDKIFGNTYLFKTLSSSRLIICVHTAYPFSVRCNLSSLNNSSLGTPFSFRKAKSVFMK